MATSPSSKQQSGLSKYGDLKGRLIFLALALVVYRIGAHVPVPGIDPDMLKQLFDEQQGGILGLFNMFSGGALSRFSVFALGIMPYISASIIMQMLSYVLPELEALRKEGRVRPTQDHPVHALRHVASGSLPRFRHCRRSRKPGWSGA